MGRVHVASRSIASIAYNETSSALDIQFQNGSTYRYFFVPQAAFDALTRAASKGTYFNQAIRKRYPFERLGDHPP